jgi:DNA primase
MTPSLPINKCQMFTYSIANKCATPVPTGSSTKAQRSELNHKLLLDFVENETSNLALSFVARRRKLVAGSTEGQMTPRLKAVNTGVPV